MRIFPHLNVTGYVAWLIMRSQASSPPLALTVLAALCVGLTRCVASESPGPQCDNGKMSLDRDLPADAVNWDCAVPTWPESTQKLPSIDTVYDPEPVRQICMDEPISYNYSIPNSGAFRPVKAESGEYLYCPPQRWLNNLHHGAVVLLHHPCAPLRERHLLSGLARSCLPGYVSTSHPQLSRHMPVALASWGRTLEMGTVASSDICDWLQTTRTTRTDSYDEDQTMKYNLLLIRSEGLDRLERSTVKKKSLRQCCEETILSLLRGTGESALHMKRKHLTHIKKGSKNREKRAAIRETEDKNNKRHNTSNILNFSTNQMNKTTSHNHSSSLEVDSVPEKRAFSDHPFPRQALQSKIQKQDQNLSSWTMINLVSNVSKSTLSADSVGLRASKFEKNKLVVQAEALQPSDKETDVRQSVTSAETDVFADGVNSKQNSSARPETAASKDESTNAVKQKDVDSAKHSKMQSEEVVDVEEREVEHKQRHSTTHTHHKGENTGFDSSFKSQPESQPQENPQPAEHSHTNSQDCDSCKAGERCDCTKVSGAEAHATAVNRGLPRTPRSDEAVWAAAALGFLLVLLTLSVLHTRLYRHWRTMPSLYWHDPRQDYDSVADVIRRRLRIAKRRRKRGRRQECVLLPSSSSSDEHP
ncbi:tumor protein p53-inducible protein 13 isoform X1 [Melanotaenia boesemani]|uniref:tumor protein p53-inducible protein 13 isoform X1 n=1 Tax=Melanotaenia boesemani TaxID=1250792 RepID=UPI001C03C76E|nr:tumor protein p53-inducible protein 13 isoform X1 [Melanotaenia boesemani]